MALAKAAVSRPGLELLALDENMVSEDGLDEVGVDEGLEQGGIPGYQVRLWEARILRSKKCQNCHCNSIPVAPGS